MAGVIAVTPRFKFFDNSGNPAVGYLLYTYASGTTTPVTTWQDQGLGSANSNPITLDANGECLLWLDQAQEYTFVLKTAAGATVRTTDDISGAGTMSGDTSSTLTNKTILAATNNVEARSGPNTTPLAMRNVLINGDFRINQRGYASTAVLASGSYGHDRWKAGASGGDYSFTQLASSTQITIASGKSLIQVVEDKNVFGGSYVLSWTGTALARYGVNTATPSGSYAASPILIAGQSAGTTMSIEFNTGTVSNVQLERGDIATPFENRLYGFDLSLCQRYCCNTSGSYTGQVTGASSMIASVLFPVRMMAAPTLLSALSYGTVTNSTGTTVALNAVSPSSISTIGAYLSLGTAASGFTAGDATLYLGSSTLWVSEL